MVAPHAWTMDRVIVLRDIEKVGENLDKLSFYATFEVSRNDYMSGQTNLHGLIPAGWNRIYPLGSLCRYARDGRSQFVETPVMVASYRNGSSMMRLRNETAEEDLSGFTFEEGPSSRTAFIQRFNEDPVKAGYFVDDRDDYDQKPLSLVEIARRKTSEFHALPGGKVALVCHFARRGARSEVVAVLDPARGYVAETQTYRWTNPGTGKMESRVCRRILEAKPIGGVWVPTKYLISWGAGALRVELNDHTTSVPASLFQIVPKPGDVRQEGQTKMRYGEDDSWRPMLSAERMEDRKENAKAAAMLREYFLWVLAGLALLASPILLSMRFGRTAKPHP